MSRRPQRPPGYDEAFVIHALRAIQTGATEDKAWTPALRAVELLGRNIGTWKNVDSEPGASPAELINQAASGGDAEPP